MRQLYCILSTLAFLLVAMPAIAQPVRTFVSSSGNDANPCSLSAPCRNFGAAINAVASGGEVVALDSAGYGPVTITRPVSVIAAPGIHAAIAPTTGMAIEINAAPSDVVVLRGLTLNSQGAGYGVYFLEGNTLHIERCVINRFSISGVIQHFGSQLIVSDSVFSENHRGLWLSPGVATKVLYSSVSRARFENSGLAGLELRINARATCLDCSASGGPYGFWASAGEGRRVELALERCTATHNSSRGIFADSHMAAGGGTAIVRVANSVIAHNSVGVGALTDTGCSGCVQLLSRGDNTLEANDTDGSFTDPFVPK